MKKANEDIRMMLKKSGVKQWELAEAYGLSDARFCVRMRKEFPEDEKLRIYDLIKLIADMKEEDENKRQEKLQNRSKEELVDMLMKR